MLATSTFRFTSKRRLRYLLGALAGLFLCIGTYIFTVLAESATTSAGFESLASDKQFETPATTIHHFRKAVKLGRWRDEYKCYTGEPQARYTYHIMVSSREMTDSHDLKLQVQNAFRKFNVPDALLDRFPSLRSTFNGDHNDPKAIEAWSSSSERALNSQREIWHREVQPLEIDWAGLIDLLQPIFTENFQRHRGQFDHPSQNGIVSHLEHFTFDPVRNLRIDGNQAVGTIFGRFRDSQPTTLADEGACEFVTIEKSWIPSFFEWPEAGWIDTWMGGSGYSEPISLVRRHDGWKIDSVKFR